ncbi:MAG: GNAT family N-acetyltransferase [Clostridia bacterium]|nr:GNAT family N-acetyltransferase [Clostridia bacterium]
MKTITETNRLILRRYRKEDLQDLYEYLSDETVVRFEPYKPMDMNEARENLDWRISTDEMIAVELKSNHKLIGNIFLGKRDCNALELGYVFNRQYWEQGYAAESCAASIRKAFSEGVLRIYAECDPCNAASWKLLERLGFTREAHFRQSVFFWKDKDNNPIWKGTYVYSILNEQAFRESGF